ncbi:E3 ubiquitin-protein ligase TTC3 [Rhinatrema bivittatum]|uniref:E3 ubiquitin-protein ligase TTC3 n=1 Tax=Rhinatrema bivittatum TaxID=194408 RepID=UPI00112B2EAA|nr:E3 ubiquitin-protein ligase TTC3 [Rhinatrema bivittatum]
MDDSTCDGDSTKATYGYFTKYCQNGHEVYTKRMLLNRSTNAGDVVEYWCSRPREELQEYCDAIKVYILWPVLFETRLHCHDEWPFVLPRNMDPSDFSLQDLNHIEIVEDIVQMAKKVVDIPFFIIHLLKIGTDIEKRDYNIGDALEWVKCTGDIAVLHKLQTLGDLCWPPLEAFFSKYKYYINKAALEQCNLMEEIKMEKCQCCGKQSEAMKQRGNEEFSKEHYDSAVKYYTKALEGCPENHLLYGNRALCFLRMGKYKKALGDGKRAIVLKGNWSKGHYRFCDALFMMGERGRALEANERAQELCKHNPEGVKDLMQQNAKFRMQMEEMKGVKLNKNKYKKNIFEKKLGAGPDLCSSLNSKGNDKKEKSKKESEIKDQRSVPKPENKRMSDDFNPETKASPSELMSGQMHKNSKMQPESKASDPDQPREHTALKSDLKSTESNKGDPCDDSPQLTVAVLMEKTKSLVLDGYTALLDERCRSAAQAFSQLLNILLPTNLTKVNLAKIDYVVLIYGHANALLGIGQPEELAKAEHQFNRIIDEYTRERFNCLALYGIGKVYFRQNRFSDALNQFVKSQTMVSHKIVPGVLTWPTTSVVVEETRMEKLQVLLDNFIEQCRFPPEPDAVCRYPLCKGHFKINIYFSDPDFKGFVRLTCCQHCKVEFHMNCWKKLKMTMCSDRSDRLDFLEEPCFTPDCGGKICHIIIFNSTGLVKCEFKHKFQKIKKQPKPAVKQKSCSPRNLKMIQEKKLKRKMSRKEAIKLSKEKTEKPKDNSFSKQDIHKDSDRFKRCFDDMIMQHITENAELIKTGVLDPTKLLSDLLSWQVISEQDYIIYSTDAASMTSAEVMELLINHVSEKDDKVNTRIFLHVLNQLEVRPKLKDWLEEVNALGLKAAEAFLARYGDCLERLDFDSLLSLWNDEYGSKLDSMICGHHGKEILEYFRGAPPEKARWLIWLLQEHKEMFPCPALHQALDCYFKIMDGPCVVLKKQGSEDDATNSIKIKNKNRKKKQKESRPIYFLSQDVGAGTAEDTLFPDENTLMFLDDYNPFIVPEYIRDQVEEFEAIYEDNPVGDHYQRILDNNPDPTRESLYDYFSQILEAYGPLEIDDPLLVGEYQHFPVEAHRLVEESGGLQAFLLTSLRFVMVGNLVVLLKHRALLQPSTATASGTEEEESAGGREEDSLCPQPSGFTKENASCLRMPLNPTAKEFKPSNYVNKSYDIPVTTALMTASSPDIPIAACPLLSSYCTDQSQPGIIKDLFLNGLDQPSILTSICVPGPEITHYLGGDVLPAIPEMDETSNPDSEQRTALGSKHESDCPGPIPLVAQQDMHNTLLESSHRSYEVDFALDRNRVKGINYDITVCGLEAKRQTSSRRRSVFNRMVAVQVDKELDHNEVNTDPFHPYETQQGDILRIEKEHQVLQEQLQEATEKYEQLQNRSRADITTLEEQLKKTIEEQQISKAELDWFTKIWKTRLKKWQQEKRENQERLKVIKNNIKNAYRSQWYLRNIDEKEQQYIKYLAEFLEISNKFAAKKMKVEENIKKSKTIHKESTERAIAAEVCLLHNRKKYELFRLHSVVSEGENNIRLLQNKTSSDPVSASPHIKSQISSLELYLLNIQRESDKIKSEFEEKIRLVKIGVQMSTLFQGQVATLQPSSNIPVVQDSILINDPAVVMYSSTPAQAYSARFGTLSSPKKQGTVPSMVHSLGDKAAVPTSSHSDSSIDADTVDVPSLTTRKSCPEKTPVAPSVMAAKGIGQNKKGKKKSSQPPAENLIAPSKQQAPKQSYDRITEQLITIFPHFSSTDLANFIKEVRTKNGNTFSRLSYDEMISQVTEHILDQQSKTSSASPQQDKLPVGKPETTPTNASAGQAGSAVQGAPKPATNVAKAVSPNPKPPPNMEMSRKSEAAQPLLPWKPVGRSAKSKWQKSNDSPSFEDPCIICHEELNANTVCVLECGHQFHKECIRTWLHAQSTCPTCRVHTLLPEDFPALAGRIRPT